MKYRSNRPDGMISGVLMPNRRRPGSFLPRQLPNLVGWYDPTDETSLIVDSSNRVSLMREKGGVGQRCLVLPGGTGENSASVASGDIVGLSGDLDLRVLLSVSNWAGGVQQPIISKWTASGNLRAFGVTLEPTGELRLYWSPDGLTTNTVTSTLPVGLTAFTRAWVRVTFDIDNGAGSNVARFFTSSEGVTWTQVGSDVVTAGVASISATGAF